jgi:hypothetical protein
VIQKGKLTLDLVRLIAVKHESRGAGGSDERKVDRFVDVSGSSALENKG